MAIKKCKECGIGVSTSAKVCPHCGKKYPTGGFTWPAKIFLIFLLLVVLGTFIGHFNQSSESTTNSVTIDSKTNTSTKNENVISSPPTQMEHAQKQNIKTDQESLQQKPNIIAETNGDDLKARIDKKLGISNLSKQSRVNNIIWKKDLNTLLILITVNDNLTESLIEHGWWSDAWQVLQMAYDDPKVQSDVMVQGFYPITDAYGNTKWRTIGAISLPRSEYQKINRNNFIPKDLIKIGVGRFNINGID
jgi:hypothetical protein